MKRVFHNTDTKSKLNAVTLFYILSGSGLANAVVPGYLEVGKFSSAEVTENLPVGWEPLTFSEIDRNTHYSLVNAGDKVVVKAVSNQSASGLTRAVTIAPAEYPILKWRWKVDNILQKGDVTTKDGDDYPARIYITFTLDPDRVGYFERLGHVAATAVFGPDVPYRAISYIWDSNSPTGTMIENPYTDRVIMFVIETGDENVQQWVAEERNVYQDYKMAFGEDPAMISGVAIMTDTDNTKESAIAWYGDIIFTKESIEKTSQLNAN